MHSAKDDMSNLKNTTGNLRSQTLDTAQEIKSDVRDTAKKASNKVLSLFHSASDELVHARDSVTSQIRTSPVQSSMIALGVGFIIGALIRR